MSSSTGKIAFPFEPNDDDKHTHNGVEYTYKANRWVVIPPDPLSLVADVYVKVEGDTMTGSLECPMFTGNYNLDVLDQLP